MINLINTTTHVIEWLKSDYKVTSYSIVIYDKNETLIQTSSGITETYFLTDMLKFNTK